MDRHMRLLQLTVLLIIETPFLFSPSLAVEPLGAAVSWVGYDNREDFHEDGKLLEWIIERQSDGDRKMGMFGIAKSRHFRVPTNSTFLKTNGSSSFEANVEQAIDALISDVKTNTNSEPFLVIGIASHGSEGLLGLQHSGGASLISLVKLLMREEDRFYQQTHKALRYEIIYSACHSGSLIDIVSPMVKNRRKAGIPTGPINVLTTTDRGNLALVSMTEGDYLLNYVLAYQSLSKQAASSLDWSKGRTTLAQFGFFSHLGPTFENFPQIYTSDWHWTPGATVEFLDEYNHSLNRVGGHGFFDRELRVDLNDLFNDAETIHDAWKVLSVQSASTYFEANYHLLRDYLRRPSKAARYASAFAVLRWTRESLPGNVRFPHLAGLVPEAKKVLLEWALDPEIKKLTESGFWFYFDLTEQLDIQDLELAKAISVLKNVFEANSDSRRPIMDVLRKYLLNRFNVKRSSNIYSHYRQGESTIDLKKIPHELTTLLLHVYYDIPLSTKLEDTVKIAFPRLHPQLARGPAGKDRCTKLISELGIDRSFGDLLSGTIDAYDNGKYVWTEWTGITLLPF
jgi:hypothetical protein